MQIRPAVATDAPGIRRVSGRSARRAYEGVVEDETIIEFTERSAFEDEVRDWLAEIADDDRVIYLVAEADDEVVGFGQLTRGDRAPEHVAEGGAFLVSLYVLPERWNEGIGTALLEACLARLPDGVTSVSLAVLADNDLAQGFYVERGFERIGEGSYEVEDVVYETERYARPLDSSD